MTTEKINFDTSNTWFGHGGPSIVRALDNNSVDEAIVYLTNLATLYYNEDEHIEAIRLYERALLLAEELQDNDKQHQLLACLGFLHNHAKHFSLAQDCFGKALELSDKPIEPQPSLHANQSMLLLAHEAARFDRRNYMDAIKVASTRMDAALKSGAVRGIDTPRTEWRPEPSWEAVAFDAYRSEQWEQLAQHLLILGLELYDVAADRTHNAGICFIEGLNYARLGDNQPQQLLLAQSATLARMQTLAESNPAAVIPTIEIGVQVAREMGDLVEEAKFLGDKMTLYKRAQDKDKLLLAIQEYAEFIDGHPTLDPSFYIDAHIALGDAHCSLDDFDTGITYYEQAIGLAHERKMAEPAMEANIQLSSALASQEKLAESEDQLNIVLEQARQAGSAHYQAYALALLSNLAYERKAYKESRLILTKAKQHMQDGDSYPAVIIANVESALAVVKNRQIIIVGLLLVILIAAFLIWRIMG